MFAVQSCMKFPFITIFIGIFISDSKVSSHLVPDIISIYSTQGTVDKAVGSSNLNERIKTNQNFFESIKTNDTDSILSANSTLNPKTTTVIEEILLVKNEISTGKFDTKKIEDFDQLHVNNVLKRNYDSLEDNEQLLLKITDDNGELPPNFQLKADVKDDPILVYNGPKIINPELRNLKKREVKTSEHYDYNYYDDIAQDDTSEVKEDSHDDSLDKSDKLPGLAKVEVCPEGMIFNANHESSTLTLKQCELSTKDNDSKVSVQSDMSIEPHETLKKNNEKKEVAYIETRKVKPIETEEPPNIILQDNPEDVDSYSYNSDFYYNESKPSELSYLRTDLPFAENLEEDTYGGIISMPKGKEACCPPKIEPAKCLPSGGPPKNPRIVVFTKTNDSEYSRLIKGDMIETLVKRVMDKVAGNTKVLKELGLCAVDLTDVRDLYRRARNKSDCCLKAEEEFKCFLTWMLTDDLPSRKKRSSREDFEESSRETEELAGAPSSVNINTPSPQYQRLFEKVEEYKESDDSWDTIIYSEAPA